MSRAGVYVKQLEGYNAFVPRPLPPEPPLNYDAELIKWMGRAERALGRLDGIATTLPNPDLFVAMYVKKEAVLSSQIEGTQASLVDVLEYESEALASTVPADVEDVFSYIKAMNFGLERLSELPLSLRLIREIHAVLMLGVRGGNKSPGEFRKSQNWIGPTNCTLKTATFVPPPVHEMHQALGDLETFLHNDDIPLLLKCGLAHCQFETIHPFLDGNGRMGRLLITFMLCAEGAMRRPLLYLSYYFKKHRTLYYDLLMAVRDEGDWESWLKFFFQGVYEVSQQATDTAQRIIAMREAHSALIQQEITGSNALRLLDYLFAHPFTSIQEAKDGIGVSYPTASTLVDRFVALGILKEMTGKQRNRGFAYTDYLRILAEGTADEP